MSFGQRLAPLERRALKARAHALDPVAWIGDGGLTEAVIAEIARALAAHALIKVRAAGLAREARENAMAEICARCAAQPVQHIGKVLVIYRKKPEAEQPARKPAASASGSRARRPARAGRASATRQRGGTRGRV